MIDSFDGGELTMRRSPIPVIGLVLTMILACGGGEPDTSENHCDSGVCDEIRVTTIAQSMQGKGFITLAENKRYFQHENGKPFIPIGHNEWYSAELFLDTERLDRYFSVMKDHGENTLRIVLDYQGFSINVPFYSPNNLVELKVGEFNPELVEALDNLVHAAERHGIYLLLAILPNLFDEVFDGNWYEHPYNKNFDPENGLVESPEELLHDPAAIRAVKARFRFFIERWGASPNIFAWELWNEMNAIGGTLEQQNEWIQEMGAFCKQLERELYGRHHLRTVSTNNAGWGPKHAGIYSSSELDFTSYHTYDSWARVGVNPFEGLPVFSAVDPVQYIQFVHQAAQVVLGKSAPRPVLGTEDMAIERNSAGGLLLWPFDQHFKDFTEEQLDDFFIGAAWASVLGGGAGSSLRWPCYPSYGEDDPEGYLALSYGMYDGQKALRRILSTLDWTGFSPTSASHAVSAGETEDFIPMALSDGRIMLAFLLHNHPEFSRTWVNPYVTFRSLQGTSYQVTWYDLRTGVILQEDRAQGPEFSLRAPTFETFVAAVVETS
jgi:mannan endo-1,4-beta-mannosidase